MTHTHSYKYQTDAIKYTHTYTNQVYLRHKAIFEAISLDQSSMNELECLGW